LDVKNIFAGSHTEHRWRSSKAIPAFEGPPKGGPQNPGKCLPPGKALKKFETDFQVVSKSRRCLKLRMGVTIGDSAHEGS
jgi:hypothetical protein